VKYFIKYLNTLARVFVPTLTTVWHCLRDLMFSRFGTIPACERRHIPRQHSVTH